MIKNIDNSKKLFLLFFIIYFMHSFLMEYVQLFFIGKSNTFNDETAFFGLTFAYLNHNELPKYVDTRILQYFTEDSVNIYYQGLALFGYLFDKIGINTFFFSKLTSITFGALSVVYLYRLKKKFLIV